MGKFTSELTHTVGCEGINGRWDSKPRILMPPTRRLECRVAGRHSICKLLHNFSKSCRDGPAARHVEHAGFIRAGVACAQVTPVIESQQSPGRYRSHVDTFSSARLPPGSKSRPAIAPAPPERSQDEPL